MSERDRANLLEILDAIQKKASSLEGITSPQQYYQAQLIFDATLMNFVVIGEMTARLSTELRQKYPAIDWQRIRDFRNLIAHDYLGIDAEEVWQIIHTHLPPLKAEIEKILTDLG